MPISMIKDPTGAPARDLTTLPDMLRKGAEKAQTALSMIGMDGLRIEVEGWIDHSVSMRSDYSGGRVQGLGERTLAAVFPVDPDGKIPFTPWDSQIHWKDNGSSGLLGIGRRKPEPFTLTVDNFEGFIAREVYGQLRMGGTNLLNVLNEIEQRGGESQSLTLDLIFTDGAPEYEEECLRKIAVMSHSVPHRHIKFVCLREEDSIRFLTVADKLAQNRPQYPLARDNCSVAWLPQYDTMPALAFYRELFKELDTWTARLVADGVVTQA